MNWFFDSFLARSAALATIYSTTCLIAAWVATTWDIAAADATVRWWLVFLSLGVVLPTAVLSTLGVLCGRPRKSVGQIAKHLLEICLLDIEYLATELSREKGPGFIKAKKEQHNVVQTYLEICRQRFRRDKGLLRLVGGSADDGTLLKYVQLKENVIATCREVEQLLAADCPSEQARDVIRGAAAKLAQAAKELESAVENFHWHD